MMAARSMSTAVKASLERSLASPARDVLSGPARTSSAHRGVQDRHSSSFGSRLRSTFLLDDLDAFRFQSPAPGGRQSAPGHTSISFNVSRRTRDEGVSTHTIAAFHSRRIGLEALSDGADGLGGHDARRSGFSLRSWPGALGVHCGSEPRSTTSPFLRNYRLWRGLQLATSCISGSPDSQGVELRRRSSRHRRGRRSKDMRTGKRTRVAATLGI